MRHVRVPDDITDEEREFARHAVREMHLWLKTYEARGKPGGIDSWAAVYRYMFRKSRIKYFIYRYLNAVDYKNGVLPADGSHYVTIDPSGDYQL